MLIHGNEHFNLKLYHYVELLCVSILIHLHCNTGGIDLWLENLIVLQIEMGSTNVRIGSTIFGAREYPKKQSN